MEINKRYSLINRYLVEKLVTQNCAFTSIRKNKNKRVNKINSIIGGNHSIGHCLSPVLKDNKFLKLKFYTESLELIECNLLNEKETILFSLENYIITPLNDIYDKIIDAYSYYFIEPNEYETYKYIEKTVDVNDTLRIFDSFGCKLKKVIVDEENVKYYLGSGLLSYCISTGIYDKETTISLYLLNVSSVKKQYTQLRKHTSNSLWYIELIFSKFENIGDDNDVTYILQKFRNIPEVRFYNNKDKFSKDEKVHTLMKELISGFREEYGHESMNSLFLRR